MRHDIKMKKYLRYLFMIIVAIGLAACETERHYLPVPAYPLDEAAVATALQKAGLSWRMEKIEDDKTNEGRMAYTFYEGAETIFIADLASGE